MDLATVDHLLTSTRSVRKRLDFTRPIPTELLEKCIEIAFQAPTGSNSQGWSVVVVTEPEKRKAIADQYRNGMEFYAKLMQEGGPSYGEEDLRTKQMPRVIESAFFLSQHLEEAPALVIFCVDGRIEEAGVTAQASIYGSILPAAWSFMLAARARGLGSSWTTLHLFHEKEVADLLGIPATVTQTVLFPVAYFTGTDFKPARRLPAKQLTHWNRWGSHRA